MSTPSKLPTRLNYFQVCSEPEFVSYLWILWLTWTRWFIYSLSTLQQKAMILIQKKRNFANPPRNYIYQKPSGFWQTKFKVTVASLFWRGKHCRQLIALSMHRNLPMAPVSHVDFDDYYRTLTRFWPPPTPFLVPLHQGRLLESGRNGQWICLLQKANQAK